jgi:hypothetical protein
MTFFHYRPNTVHPNNGRELRRQDSRQQNEPIPVSVLMAEPEARSYLNAQYEQLHKLIKESDKWRANQISNSVRISTRDYKPFTWTFHTDGTLAIEGQTSKKGPPLIRGEAIIRDCSPEEFFQFVDSPDVEIQRKFDPKLLEIQTAKTFNPNDSNDVMIVRASFQSPSVIVSNRDFVFVRDARRSEDGNKICNLSSSVRDTVEWPHIKGFIRGFIHFSYWELERIHCQTPNDLKVTYINCIELKGLIPQFILNLLSNDQPLVITQIAKLLDKELIPISSAK